MDHDAILRAVVKPLVWGPSRAAFRAAKPTPDSNGCE